MTTKNLRPTAILAIVGVCLMAAAPTIRAQHAATPYKLFLPSGFVGKPVPKIAVASVAGKGHVLGAIPGRWVYVDFFASWCGPCNQEMPTLVRDARRYASTLTIIAIDEREHATKARAFMRKYHAPFAVYLDPADSTITPTDWKYHVYGADPSAPFGTGEEAFLTNMLPGGILIDPHGIVRATLSGFTGKNELADQLRALRAIPSVSR